MNQVRFLSHKASMHLRETINVKDHLDRDRYHNAWYLSRWRSDFLADSQSAEASSSFIRRGSPRRGRQALGPARMKDGEAAVACLPTPARTHWSLHTAQNR